MKHQRKYMSGFFYHRKGLPQFFIKSIYVPYFPRYIPFLKIIINYILKHHFFLKGVVIEIPCCLIKLCTQNLVVLTWTSILFCFTINWWLWLANLKQWSKRYNSAQNHVIDNNTMLPMLKSRKKYLVNKNICLFNREGEINILLLNSKSNVFLFHSCYLLHWYCK